MHKEINFLGLFQSQESMERNLIPNAGLLDAPIVCDPWCIQAELQKVNILTQAAFLGSKNLHQTLKVRDSRQIQRYQKCVIRDISKLNMLKNSVKHQETVKNTRKQCETVTDRDTFGFQLLSQTPDIYLHHPS